MDLNYFDSALRAKKKYAQLLDPICQQWGLTRNELDVMLFLTNNPQYDRAADIVTRRGIAKSHVSLSVGNLEKRGYLTRHFDENDRRTVHLTLSEEAKAIARTARECQIEFFSRIFKGLTREELTLWQSLYARVCANIEHLDDAEPQDAQNAAKE